MSNETKRHLLLAAWTTLILALTTLPIPQRLDICTYYTAGTLLLEGEPEVSFSEAGLRQRHEELHFPRPNGAFVYSPLYLLPSAALASLSFRAAEVVSHSVGVLSLGVLLFLLLQRSRSLLLEGALCLVFLLSHVVLFQFEYQNWSFLLAAMVALAWELMRRGSTRGAALVWALTAHMKIYAGLFVLVLGMANRRKVAVLAVVIGLILALLTLPIVGLSSWQAYADTMLEFAGKGVTPYHHKVSVQAWIARAMTDPAFWSDEGRPVEHPLIRWLLPITLPFFLALIWWRRDDWEWGIAATIPYLLLFNPTTWDHSQILFLVVLPALRLRVALVLCALLCASWFYFDVLWWRLVGVAHYGHSSALAQLVLLFYPLLNVVALVDLIAQPRQAEASRLSGPTGELPSAAAATS